MKKTRLMKLITIMTAFVMMLGIVPIFTMNVEATQSHKENFSTNYKLTGNGATDILNIAMAQIGKTGSQLGYTEEWCANFVSDCADLAGQSAAVPRTGAVNHEYTSSEKWYGLKQTILRAGGVDVGLANAQPGDIVFFSGHVEIVYSGTGSSIKSVGGNTGKGSTLYSRVVCSPRVHGSPVCVLRPNYSGVTVEPEPLPGIPLDVIPGSNVINTEFSWGTTEHAVSYGLRIYEDENWNNQVYSVWDIGSTTQSVLLPTGTYMAQCMYKTADDEWIFGELEHFSVGFSMQVTPGTNLTETKFYWGTINNVTRYGVRVYEADNWENQVYATWDLNGPEDAVILPGGDYMAQCMYRTSEEVDWVFGDLVYFNIGTSTIPLQVLPGTDNEATQFNWNSITSAIKYGVRIYEADNWENQVYSNWTHTGLEDSVQLKSGNYMAQCMYRTTEDGNWVFGDLIYFSVGTSTVSLQVLPGTDNEATQFNWNSIASAIKYGVRIYEADNWENQVYSNWTYTGLEDSVQLKSGNYMAQCMYRTTEDGDWAFGDLIYFKVTEGYLQADINQSGTTTLLDALLLQKHLLHLKSLTVEQKAAADMNSDGRVNIFDLSLLKEHLQ